MARNKLKTELRQEQILEAALAIVSAKGMKGLNTGAVARRVGIVPSALYRHFRNKEQILEALLELIEERLIANVNIARQEAACPLSALEILLKRHVRLIRENAGIPLVIFSEEVYGADSQRKTITGQTMRKGSGHRLRSENERGRQRSTLNSQRSRDR